MAKIIPKSTLGKYSVLLILLMPLLFLLGNSLTNSLYESVSSGDTILKDLRVRPVLVIAMLTGFASGLSALVLSLISIIKKKERSFLVFIALLVGILLLIFLVLEIAFPH